MGTPTLTDNPMPKFLPASPLRPSHLFPCPSVPDRQMFLHLKARHPSSHAHHACNLPPPIPAPHQRQPPPASQFSPEKTHTDRTESVHAISCGQRWGTLDNARHSLAFPCLLQALPPSRAKGRGITPAGKRALGSPGTAPLLCKQHGTKPGNRNNWGQESKL